MRQARSLPPRRGRFSRTVALLGLVATGWGCQQPPYYFYYGTGSPATVPVVPPPAGAIHTESGGPATEVIEGGTTSLDVPARTTTVTGSEPPSSRVVVSEPENRTVSSWRPKPNPDTDPAISTSVAGGTRASTDPSINR